MNDFIQLIESSMPVGQRHLLGRYLADVQSGRAPGDAEEIQALLAQAGRLLDLPAGDVTLPEGYNLALRTLVANLAGLYQEVDRLDSAHQGLTALNRSELDKIELALRDLSTILAQATAANAPNLQYSDIWFESFGPGTEYERDARWFKPIPVLAEQGLVESFLPAYIDPVDRSLKLAPGGDFSRSVSAHGEPLVQATVEEVLGLSVDRTHGLDQAIDGKLTTYWRELVLSDAPIYADPAQVLWLPETYSGGAACRLHFRFPFTVPFTEIQLRPFSRYPVHCLQVVWDNRKDVSDSVLANGDFAAGAAHWTALGLVEDATVAFFQAGGYHGHGHVEFISEGSRVRIQHDAIPLARNDGTFFHLHLRIQREPGQTVRALVQWYRVDGSAAGHEWVTCEGPENEWYEFSRLLLAPSPGIFTGATDDLRPTAALSIVADGSGHTKVSDIVLSPAAGKNADLAPDPESNILTVQLDGAVGTDVWLVLCQPHYEFLQVAIPEGDLDSQALWEDLQLAAKTKAEGVFQPDVTPWALAGDSAANRGRQLVRIDDDGRQLLREVKQWGGRIKEMASQLLRYIQADPAPRSLNRFLYTLGAWEIGIRHREYAPQGLFISTPYRPRGEAREARLLTNPPLSELLGGGSGQAVRFWMTARAEDTLDKAKLFAGRATFAAPEEELAPTSDCHFSLAPLTRREEFQGTDRYARVALQYHPYVNRERVWKLQQQVGGGKLAWPLQYDANKADYFVYAKGTPYLRALYPDDPTKWTLRRVEGYRPVQVTLQLPDGTTARPDILGPVQVGDVGYSGAERLEQAMEQHEEQLLDDGDDDINADPDDPVVKPPRRRKKKRQGVQLPKFRLPRLPKKKRRKRRKQRIFRTVLQTRFKDLVAGPHGAAFSLYWHKSSEDTDGAPPVTTHDVLVSPHGYQVDAENGIVTVKTTVPNGDKAYDSFLGYYYYWRDETNGREEFDDRDTLPTAGIDHVGPRVQAYPVTRNMTDWVNGNVRDLRPAVLDDLDADYYPVFEYLIDNQGRVCFANNLNEFGEIFAKITVDYQTLALEPRLIVEFPRQNLAGFSSHTPVLFDYTLMMQARK